MVTKRTFEILGSYTSIGRNELLDGKMYDIAIDRQDSYFIVVGSFTSIDGETAGEFLKRFFKDQSNLHVIRYL